MHTLAPSAVKTHGLSGFIGSNLGHYELEVVARNIIIFAKRQKRWPYFTRDIYKDICQHAVSKKEMHILDELVKKGFLAKAGNTYTVKVNNLKHLIGDYILT